MTISIPGTITVPSPERCEGMRRGDELQESLAHVMQGLHSVPGYGFTVEE